VAVAAAAREPLVRQRRPARVVVVGLLVQEAVVADVERPAVVRTEEDVVHHGQALARNRRRRYRDGLQRRVQVLGGRPGGEAGVTAAAHADLPVAPLLVHDPVDDVVGVGPIVLVGVDRSGGQALAARIGGHGDIAVIGGVLAA